MSAAYGFVGSAKQQGIALLTVMLLTVIASLIVFTALSSSVTQERMSGNFQKKINAELQSDKAIFESFHRLNAYNRLQPHTTTEELAANAEISNHSKGGRAYQASSKVSAGNLQVDGRGFQYHDSQSTTKAIFQRTGAGLITLPSPFEHGITGCDGVAVQGSGRIDSYNSAEGGYNLARANSNSAVRTITPDADLVLTGASPIWGDVQSTGGVSLTGSTNVSGRVHANGDVLLTGGSIIGGSIISGGLYTQASGAVLGDIFADGGIHISQGGVGGSLYTMGDYWHRGVQVPGLIHANGNVTLEMGQTGLGILTAGDLTLTTWQDDKIRGAVRVVGDVNMTSTAMRPIAADNLLYGGDLRFQGWTQAGHLLEPRFNQLPMISDVTPVPRVAAEGEIASGSTSGTVVSCDPLHLTQAIAEVVMPDNPPDLVLTPLPDRFEFSSHNGNFTRRASGHPQQILFPLSASFLKLRRTVYQLASVVLDGDMYIYGDLTLLVSGDFSMGAVSKLYIPDGSSLTLVVQGKFSVSAAASIITPISGVTEQGTPVFSLYSGYNGDDGVLLNGVADMYAAIYAPYTDVVVAGSGQLYGSVVGKTVSVSGAGGIHYDEALAMANVGAVEGEASKSRIVFAGWF
ncbi:hypothetical protein [Shewanella sp. CG12_big_fil_rev_8_21_14_0_65_47_15]|uniref:pilus assembly PilX family protein n=1 Tax=Shewanella sp. CG12_big_fil_rev_8_21_14_0_65_47_15 TaxID=1975537 RepID=UPI000CA863F2|nr:hypothetical protein [Shewanella sp. CG12_big_fil_rev_8_21_14_0_65_47_15]PIW59262.1 MAG: hypothetical protein COW15_18515 [Shewanella sp. CG12_big_fil_rev_8_21_14_0_65_47_15]